MEDQLTLFNLPKHTVNDVSEEIYKGKPRINSPVRNLIELRKFVLDDLVPKDHKVRFVWAFINNLDLSNFLLDIQAVKGKPGRPTTDPRLLLALWVYATIEGIGSGRVIARYCEEHNAFAWLCGQVAINYHTLNDFRSNNEKKLEDLLVQIIAILVKRDLITLERISQDGIRVRACAGRSSFHRKNTLEKHQKEVRARLEILKKQKDDNPADFMNRKKAAELRATEDRNQRITNALKELEEHSKTLQFNKKKHGKQQLTDEEKNELRSSTTDPEARKMKMANGGFSPAYNVQLATETKSQIIVGLSVTNSGSDAGEMSKMMKKVMESLDVKPNDWLVDKGYTSNVDLDKTRQLNSECKVYMPGKNMESPDTSEDCYISKASDSEAVKEWKINMGKIEAKDIYKERAATSECVNASARNRGLQQFVVKGIQKVTSNVFIFVLTHNIVRAMSLLNGLIE